MFDRNADNLPGTYAEYATNLYTGRPIITVAPGNVYDSAIPIADVLTRFAAERVTAEPAGYFRTSTGQWHEHAGQWKIVRDRDQHVHGERGHDNGQQYEFLTDLATGVTGTGRGDLKITGAGTCRNGGRAYLQIGTGELSTVRGMDFQSFLTFGMSHNGSLPVVSSFGNMIIACANIIASLLGMKAVNGARTKQTVHATSASHVSAHKIKLGLEETADEMSKALQTFGAITVSDEQWSTFVQRLVPIAEDASNRTRTNNENQRGELNRLYVADERCAPWHGSALGALQAANTFHHWARPVRGETTHAGRMFDEYLSDKLAGIEASHATLLQSVLVAA